MDLPVNERIMVGYWISLVLLILQVWEGMPSRLAVILMMLLSWPSETFPLASETSLEVK